MFNFTTVVFDGTSPTFISQTLRDGTTQVQIWYNGLPHRFNQNGQ